MQMNQTKAHTWDRPVLISYELGIKLGETFIPPKVKGITEIAVILYFVWLHYLKLNSSLLHSNVKLVNSLVLRFTDISLIVNYWNFIFGKF